MEKTLVEPESEEKENQPEPKQPSLFPLFASGPPTPAPTAIYAAPQWLSNASFTANLSAIDEVVSNLPEQQPPEESEEENEGRVGEDAGKSKRDYELLESSESERESGRRERDRKRRKKKRKRLGEDRGADNLGFGKRKSGVKAWADSDVKTNSKDYYFDSRGDYDNLAYGSIYRMDIARYRSQNSPQLSGIEYQQLYRYAQKGLTLDRDNDIDGLDSKLKSGGRYWSAKYAAIESQKNLKRLRVVASKNSALSPLDDFIPLLDPQTSTDSVNNVSVSRTLVEESWDDEVLRKTREFNKMTREYPHDEKVWLSFAEFQDKVASKQPQKGARLQTLEKKISILEKAAELNTDNEELLLSLLKAYQSRDTIDVLIARWEKILMQHSGSYKLWREFLHVVQGEFSRFKVSDMRKMYAHAIQALSSACSKQFRQVHQSAKMPSPDSEAVQLELGLVDIFLSLCRFEWQAGYQELATALFQAEIEYSMFCPSLQLTEQSKQRLFEYFWSSGGARVGEEGALGWVTWLEKEEENRQKVMKEEMSQNDDQGGWTGWLEPLSKKVESSANLDDEGSSDVPVEGSQLQPEDEDNQQEEDTEALLKMLGIDVDTGAGAEVKDVSTWIKWSEEEFSRDCNQWMPLHAKSGTGSAHSDGASENEIDEQSMRIIVYEDVCEYLFSLNSVEARLSLVSQFIEFYGGRIFPRISTNSSCWTERLLSIDSLPDLILQQLRRMDNILSKLGTSSPGASLELLLDSSYEISKQTDMIKFLRNAILLCLSAFPRNHILEEAVLIAEELSLTKMNSSNCSVPPCRSLAKNLLKSDRQDVLLCGVYAQREAAFGNIDPARRVFDMALSSIEGLPMNQQSHASIIYFWYAEAELANDPDNNPEAIFRAMHILSCLGGGVKYSPYKSQPSNLQLLRARQGFKEKLKSVRSLWLRGFIDDPSLALVCSAALFEELTAGWAAAIEILDQAFSMVLPERRSHTYQLEMLSIYHVRMLQRHHKKTGLSKAWESILQGLQIYPFNPELLNSLVEIGHLYTTPNKLRLIFDDYSRKKPSVIGCLFALSFELSRGGSQYRIRGLFERALAEDGLSKSIILWRCYIAYEIIIAGNPSAARRIFFRAIHACPWSKKLWLDGFTKLHTILTAKELSDLQEVMRDKELNLRTDIYEILLQDEFVS